MNWESWLGCTSKGEVPSLVHFCKQECYCQEQRAVKVVALIFRSLLPALDTLYIKQVWSQGALCSVENKTCMNMLSCLPGHQISPHQNRLGNCHSKSLPKMTGCHASLTYPFFPVHGNLPSLFPTTGEKRLDLLRPMQNAYPQLPSRSTEVCSGVPAVWGQIAPCLCSQGDQDSAMSYGIS